VGGLAGEAGHCARARFRDYDGRTRDVEATGPTGPAASRALQAKLRDRIAPNDDEITRETYVNTLADLWLAEIIAEERITPQTIDRYTASLRIVIRPGIGNLRLRESTVGRLDKMFRTVAADRPSLAKNAKVAADQMFALAVRRGALATNIAFRWEDVDLAAEHPTLTICGTIVYVKASRSPCCWHAKSLPWTNAHR
jgi:hypothetical protein